MSAHAPTTEPLSDPCEMAIRDWMKLRLKDLHERHGVEALSVHATWYPHSGQIDARWCLHMDGECVVDEGSIAEGLRALKAKLAETAATEALA